ncbi:MAG: beta-lactamase-like protein 2 [Deltaproteobacteria bacterium]|nr:beta-lactamase-like protein 2 [Deltaproteobacteria bacterium]
MSSPPTMIGLEMPDFARWSDRVVVALGQNPSVFTGPGTNTYLIGTGPQRILLDTGGGEPEYLTVLERAMAETGCEGLQEIVLTHGHPDHIGGAIALNDHLGPVHVSKKAWPEVDENYHLELRLLEDGDVIETEGARLRAVYTPGHAIDHLCFVLEEEGSLFSGDNVLGIGTTVIPSKSGSLADYMQSLHRMLEERPKSIYPAHGPLIADGVAKIREYIAHREERDAQIMAAMREGAETIPAIVKIVYKAYPESLYAAAGQSVCSHLLKLEREGRVAREGDPEPLTDDWQLA